MISSSGTPVVTSTIQVSGVNRYLSEIEVVTGLEHTFSGDLDVTLQSPAGTVVTLTTDNGGAFDNVFNGTRWSDRADPGGQVPYAAPPLLAVDALYANNVVQEVLAPEEAFGAFRGEDPTGTWTLTISDDTNIDGGTLTGWTLRMRTRKNPPGLVQRTVSSGAPVVLADQGTITDVINVSGLEPVLDHLTVTTGLTHTFPGDIDMTLMSPAGTVVTLTTDNAQSNDNSFDGTVWSDKANPGGQVPYEANVNNGLVTDTAYQFNVPQVSLTPEEGLAAFAGEDPNGAWTLTISDDAAEDTGELSSWSLDLSACDGKIDGVKVTAKAKQKFKKKVALKVKAKAAEKATAVATGAVTIKGVKGKLALKKAKVKLVAGKAKTLTLRFAGSKKKAKKANAAVKKALAKKKKVTAKITVKVTDQHGNTKTVKKTVRVVR